MNNSEECIDSSLLSNMTSYAPHTYERATLTRNTPSANRSSSERCTPTKQSSSPGESSAFWALIGIMLVLAVGNLSVTFFAMGVLRLGTGMESIEFIPGDKMITKFFGMADLANIQKEDGIIHSYGDIPFSMISHNSKISLSIRTKNNSPFLDISPERTELRNIKEFKVLNPMSGKVIYSTLYPNFSFHKKVKNLSVKKTHTPRIVSRTYSDLEVNSDATIRLRGNEGLKLTGKKLLWVANEDIYFKTLNGSIILEGSSGIFIDVETLPYSRMDAIAKATGQYKLCICLPNGLLYRVPIPVDNDQRNPANQINCSSFSNPCEKFVS